MAATAIAYSSPELAEQPIVASRALSNVVALLLCAHLWLAFSTLKAAQIGVELTLMALLGWLLSRCVLTWIETALLLVFAISMAMSVAYNPLDVTMLNGKVFGLAILSLLVFSKVRFQERVSLWVLAANIALMSYQSLFGDPGWYQRIVNAIGGSWAVYLNSRPLGVFMSTHASASLTAVLFVWLALRSTSLLRATVRSAVGLGLLVLTYSFYVLLSYICQSAALIFARLRLGRLALVGALVVAALVVMNASAILGFNVTRLGDYFTYREEESYSVIAGQLLNPKAYTTAFTWVPKDARELGKEFIYTQEGNEIGYFDVLQQGGFVLAVFFMGMLFTRIDGFRTFMAVSMLHYGMATIPLMIYLLVQWSQYGRARNGSDAAPYPDSVS